jgi:hypothetical protein
MTDPTLKLVVAWSDRRNLCSLVRDAIGEFLPEGEQLPLGEDATVIYTAETPAEIRDRLRKRLMDCDHLLVTEFEVWSSQGDGADARWLLRRQH